jgi:hypothetical protein
MRVRRQSHRLPSTISSALPCSIRTPVGSVHSRDTNSGRTGQHLGRQARLGGQHPYLVRQLQALAHQLRDVAQHLGQLSTGLPLQLHGHHEESDFVHGHALGQCLKGVVRVPAQLDLFGHQVELAGQWLRTLFGRHLQGGGKGMAAAQRAGHQVQGIGQLQHHLP